jgi:hypothetical protein
MIRETKPKRIKWIGHAARMGNMTKAYRVSVRKLHDPGTDGRIILWHICSK